MSSLSTIPKNWLFAGAGIVAGLYSTSFIYTYNNYDEVLKDLSSKNFNGGLLEMSAVMMFRGLSNVTLGLLYIPLSLVEHSLIGINSGWNILIEELGNVPDVLKWIYNSWFVEILKKWIGWSMGYLGWVLKPVWTGIVKLSIYGGLVTILLSPAFLGYWTYLKYF